MPVRVGLGLMMADSRVVGLGQFALRRSFDSLQSAVPSAPEPFRVQQQHSADVLPEAEETAFLDSLGNVQAAGHGCSSDSRPLGGVRFLQTQPSIQVLCCS